jgi:hypothetical protein
MARLARHELGLDSDYRDGGDSSVLRLEATAGGVIQ